MKEGITHSGIPSSDRHLEIKQGTHICERETESLRLRLMMKHAQAEVEVNFNCAFEKDATSYTSHQSS